MNSDSMEVFKLKNHLMNPVTGETYVYVAKVACSVLKTGFIAHCLEGAESAADIRREVHQRAREFRISSKGQLADNATKVVVLRDPWERLVSAFIDKFIVSIPSNLTGQILAQIGMNREEISMEAFVTYLSQTPTDLLNEHWVPQVAHLFSDLDYQFVGIETLHSHPAVSRWLTAAGDVRRNSVGERLAQPGASQMAVSELKELKRRSGSFPQTNSFELPQSSDFWERFIMPDQELRLLVKGENYGVSYF